MRKTIVLFVLTISINASANYCGQSGTIQERIADCNDSSSGLSLVSEDIYGQKVWKDMDSKLVWSDLLNNHNSIATGNGKGVHYSEALKACNNLNLMDSKIKWSLPTKQQIDMLSRDYHKIMALFPSNEYGVNNRIWTSTLSFKNIIPGAYTFDGSIYLLNSISKTYYNGEYNVPVKFRVRCVFKDK